MVIVDAFLIIGYTVMTLAVAYVMTKTIMKGARRKTGGTIALAAIVGTLFGAVWPISIPILFIIGMALSLERGQQ